MYKIYSKKFDEKMPCTHIYTLTHTLAHTHTHAMRNKNKNEIVLIFIKFYSIKLFLLL